GLVQANAGFLSLDAGGTSSGTFKTIANTTNNFGGLTHTLVAGARFEGPGLFSVWQNYTASGLAIAAPIIITNRFLLNVGGTLQGTNTVTFTGPFDWVGGTMNDTGTTVFWFTAAVNFSSSNTKAWRQRTIDNQANVVYSGGGWLGDIGGVWINESNGTSNFNTD